MVIFLEVSIWKLVDYSYVPSSLSTIMRHIQKKITYKKNPNLYFKGLCTKIDGISLSFAHFFFSQIKLGFGFNLVLIGILDNSHHNSLTFLTFVYHLIFYRSWSYSVPLRFFIRTSKFLMRFDIIFSKFFSFKIFLLCSYFPWNIIPC